jgi:peptidoglycan/xylan/chitin deacetylase (PgdA/CDA1 family)
VRLRKAVFRLLRATGLPTVARNTLQLRGVTILLYHDPDPQSFARHLAVLTRRYRIVSLRTFVDALLRGRLEELPTKALVLTLDDGHRGNYELTTVIRDLQVPITIFLCSGVVGSSVGFWFQHTLRPQELKNVPDELRVAELESTGFRQDEELPNRESLSDEEILEMSGELVDFQSHTVTHPILPLCSEAKAREELVRSRRDLMTRYDLDIYALAFPNGDYSGRDIDLARSAGYRCALTLDRGFNTSATDPLRLRRISIDDADGIDELVVKASGVWGLVRKGRSPRPLDTAIGFSDGQASRET